MKFNLNNSWIFVMRCSNARKYKKLQANLKKEIVNYFQIKFAEYACDLMVV